MSSAGMNRPTRASAGRGQHGHRESFSACNRQSLAIKGEAPVASHAFQLLMLV